MSSFEMYAAAESLERCLFSILPVRLARRS
jgi:hypothetical protein